LDKVLRLAGKGITTRENEPFKYNTHSPEWYKEHGHSMKDGSNLIATRRNLIAAINKNRGPGAKPAVVAHIKSRAAALKLTDEGFYKKWLESLKAK